MVQILPFAGWRYDLSQVGALSEVVTPPNSLIDESLQRTLYRQHPCNAIRLAMNREEPGDVSPRDRSARADDFWRLWKREGVLLREHELAFYIVETTFQMDGSERARWSVLARLCLPEQLTNATDLLSLVNPDENLVAQHAELLSECQATFAPIVGLLEDTTGADSDQKSLSDHFELLVRQMPPIECIGDDGVRHRMWAMTDQNGRTELARRLANFSVLMTENANEFFAAMERKPPGTDSKSGEAAATTMICLIPSDDAGIEFLPHVLTLAAPTALSAEQACQLLSSTLQCELVGAEPNASEDATELARLNSQQPCLAVGTSDGTWMIVSDRGDSVAASNEAPMERLVAEVLRLISGETATTQSLVSHRLPLDGSGLAQFVRGLKNTTINSVIIIKPPVNTAEIATRATHNQTFPEAALRLHPCVPTGLVFSSISSFQP